MATTYKTLTNSDKVSTRTLLHEAVPITGTIVSGTYMDSTTANPVTEKNIKNYTHGMFQSVYDYPYLSSSANHIFDVTVGYSSNSSLSGAASVQNAKKINIYNQMAQVLVGFDHTGSVREFDRDGDFSTGTKLRECIFVNFARLLYKDEIKKGSLSLVVATGSTMPKASKFAAAKMLTISDHNASANYKVNSPAGEYGILYTASAAEAGTGVGLVYYQAGIAVLTSSIFDGFREQTPEHPYSFGRVGAKYDTSSVNTVMSSSYITSSADGFRNRLYNIEFDNTTELNSSIYFCRAHHNDFNYSSNPTYLTGSKIRVKGNNKANEPVSYVTSVGLYSANNELLAVAKLSEPLKKTPSNELTLRCRLDY